MDATAEMTQATTRKEYKSPSRVLASFFERSRDGWKQKYQELKATVKGYKIRIADLTKSREHWRLKAKQAGEQLSTLEAEIDGLRTEIAALEEKKRPNRWANEPHVG
jgi:uncharacterized protein YdaU (DUF1376 family)